MSRSLNRCLAAILTIVMMFSFLPATTFAAPDAQNFISSLAYGLDSHLDPETTVTSASEIAPGDNPIFQEPGIMGTALATDSVTTVVTAGTAALDSSDTSQYPLNITRGSPTAKDVQIADTLANLSQNVYKNTADDWAAVSMSAVGLSRDVAGKTVIENARAAYVGTAVTTWERAAIALTAIGVDASAFYGGNEGHTALQTLDLIAKFGNIYTITSNNEAIFGLIALDSGSYSDEGLNKSRQDFIDHLLANQAGAGWAYTGKNPDVDTTAMALTALTPYNTSSYPPVQSAVTRALSWLSAQQQSDGSFNGNTNSTAMVIVALASLGIDADTDANFVKDTNSALDGLLSFVTTDNQFGFKDNTVPNTMATEQGFRALAAYQGFLYTGGPYSVYQFAIPTGDGTALTGETDPSNPLPDPNAPKNVTVRVVNMVEDTTLMQPTTVSVSGTHLDALKTALTAIGKNPATDLSESGGWIQSILGVHDSSGFGLYSWMWLLNGNVASEMINGLQVAEGDEVTLYFQYWSEDYYITAFDTKTATLTSGDSLTLTLTGFSYDMWTNSVSPTTLINNATVYAYDVSRQEIGVSAVTDAAGKATLTFPTVGTYTVSARRAGAENQTDLIPPLCTVSVSSSGGSTPGHNPTAYFSLQGLDSNDKEETWINRKAVSNLAADAKASDVIIKALEGTGYSQVGAAAGYVRSVTTPDSFTLAEKHNGMPNSGWLYKVNSLLPTSGMNAYTVRDGDHILLYFTKDYAEDPDAGKVTGGGRGSSGGGSAAQSPPQESEEIENPEKPLASFPGDRITADRLAGYDRIETAVEISRKGWTAGADTVVLTYAYSFPDALAAAPLAASLNAPMLLSDQDQTAAATLTEIQRLNPDKILLVGGTGVLSQNLEHALAEQYTVSRLAGNTCYDTAAKIAQELGAAKGTAIVVNGNVFSDALIVSSYAAYHQIPILFNDTQELPAVTARTLTDLNITSTIVVGGMAVVSEEIYSQLPSPVRYAGNTCYDTAVAVADGLEMNVKNIFVTTGVDFPDALVAGPLAGQENNPVLLIDTQLDTLPASVESFLKSNRGNIEVITAIGGMAVLKPIHVTAIENLCFAARENDPPAEEDIPAGTLDNLRKYVQTIVAGYQEIPDLSDWEAMGLLSAGESLPPAKLAAVKQAVLNVNGNFSLPTDIARTALLLQLADVDITDLEGINLLKSIYESQDMGKQGLNGYIFSLLVLSNAPNVPETAEMDALSIVEAILSTQNTEGGFPLSPGGVSNADITCMSMTALGPYRNTPKVEEAVNKAISYLTNGQNSDGSFTYGAIQSSETLSQLIIALCANGITPDDKRFVKEGKTLMDVLLTYKNSDGGFAHTRGEESNGMATEQALLALESYERFFTGGNPVYVTGKNTLKPSLLD